MEKLEQKFYIIGLRIRLAWRKLINPAGYEEAERQADAGFQAQIMHINREQEEARKRGEKRLTDLQLAVFKVINQSPNETVFRMDIWSTLQGVEFEGLTRSFSAVKRSLDRLVDLELLEYLDSGYFRRLITPAEELAIIESEVLRREQLIEGLQNTSFHA